MSSNNSNMGAWRVSSSEGVRGRGGSSNRGSRGRGGSKSEKSQHQGSREQGDVVPDSGFKKKHTDPATTSSGGRGGGGGAGSWRKQHGASQEGGTGISAPALPSLPTPYHVPPEVLHLIQPNIKVFTTDIIKGTYLPRKVLASAASPCSGDGDSGEKSNNAAVTPPLLGHAGVHQEKSKSELTEVAMQRLKEKLTGSPSEEEDCRSLTKSLCDWGGLSRSVEALVASETVHILQSVKQMMKSEVEQKSANPPVVEKLSDVESAFLFLRFAASVYLVPHTAPCTKVKEILNFCSKHTASGLTVLPEELSSGSNSSTTTGSRRQSTTTGTSPPPVSGSSVSSLSQDKRAMLLADLRYLCLSLITTIIMQSSGDLPFVHWQVLFPPMTSSLSSGNINHALNHPVLGPFLLDPFAYSRAQAGHLMQSLVTKSAAQVKMAQEPKGKQRNQAAMSFTATASSAFFVLEVILNAVQVGLKHAYSSEDGSLFAGIGYNKQHTADSAAATSVPTSSQHTNGWSSFLSGWPPSNLTVFKATYWGLLSSVSTQAPFPKCPSLPEFIRASFEYPKLSGVFENTDTIIAATPSSSGKQENSSKKKTTATGTSPSTSSSTQQQHQLDENALVESIAVVSACCSMTKTNDKVCYALLGMVHPSKEENIATAMTPLLARFDFLCMNSRLASNLDLMKILLTVTKALNEFQGYAVSRWWKPGLFEAVKMLHAQANAPAHFCGGIEEKIARQRLVLDVVTAVVGEPLAMQHQVDVFKADMGTLPPGSEASAKQQAAALASHKSSDYEGPLRLPQKECQYLLDHIILDFLNQPNVDESIKTHSYKAAYKFQPAFYTAHSPAESEKIHKLFYERGIQQETSNKCRGEALCGIGVLGETVPQFRKYWKKYVEIAASNALTSTDANCQMRACFALTVLTQRLRKEKFLLSVGQLPKKEAQAFSEDFPAGYSMFILDAILASVEQGQTVNDFTKVSHCFRCLGHLAHTFEEMEYFDIVERRPDVDGVAGAIILEFLKGLHKKKDQKEKNNAIQGIGEAFMCYDLLQSDPAATRTLVEAVLGLVKSEPMARVRSKATAVLMRLPQEFFDLYSRQIFDAAVEALRHSGLPTAFTQFKERDAVRAQLQTLIEAILIRLNPEDREEVMARFQQHAGSEPGIGIAAFLASQPPAGNGGGSVHGGGAGRASGRGSNFNSTNKATGIGATTGSSTGSGRGLVLGSGLATRSLTGGGGGVGGATGTATGTGSHPPISEEQSSVTSGAAAGDADDNEQDLSNM